MPHGSIRSFVRPVPPRIAFALLCASILFVADAVFAPGHSLAADTTRAAACDADLRTNATTSASVKVSIKTDARVTVTRAVSGTAYKSTCAGRTVSGSTWFLISAIDGKTVKSLYGISYVYGAAGMFKTIPVYPACRVYLRTRPFSDASKKVLIPQNTPVTVGLNVPGGAYHTVCNGVTVSGVTWLRIDAINGRSIRSLYGIDSVYAPLAIFKPAPVPTTTPPPTTGGIPVPSSIDATGRNDASASLNSWLGTLPSGSTVLFKAGGTYRMDKGLRVSKSLTVEGNGATLKSNGDYQDMSSLVVVSGTGVKIRGFKLVGNSPSPGVYRGGQEWAHGILTIGGGNIEIANVTVSGVYGDCLKVGKGSNTVSFHDSTCTSVGRNGVSIISASNVTIQRVAFPKSGYCTFDIEPNQSTEVVRNIKFLNNTAGTWTNTFLSAEGAAGSVVNGVTVNGNTVTGKSLKTIIALARRQNVVFTNNTSLVMASGPVLSFSHIDGLTVTGNNQPLSSGSLATITDSTNVTYR
jgi:hypothetical protein